MTDAYVVTGGGRGVGRAVVERLLEGGGAVVVVELHPDAATWVPEHPAAGRVATVTGDAGDEAVAQQAADRAEALGTLVGWVNNAAVFHDATLDTDPAGRVVELIAANLGPAVVGASTAVRRFLAKGTGGAIVNVSSHQATRAVRGALPYATAKAAVEGLTRALAVDYGPHGIRANAVALGSITTERYEAYLSAQSAGERARTEEQMARLHPLGRVGTAAEVAEVVAFLLSAGARYVNGATVPVDGGRAAQGLDPEQT